MIPQFLTVSLGNRLLDVVQLLGWIEQGVGIGWLTASENTDHPIARAWRVANAEVITESETRSNNFPRVIAFAELLVRLEDFTTRRNDGTVEGGSTFRDSLLLRATDSVPSFDGAETEAIVAYGHSACLGMPAIAINPADERTPDFEISVGGRPVAVECKARTTEPPEHRQVMRVRTEIGRRLQPLMQDVKANYCVAIEIDHVPSDGDADALINYLKSHLSTGHEFVGTPAGFRVRATIPLAKDQDVIAAELQPLGEADHVPEPVRSFMLDSGVSRSSSYATVIYLAEMRREENPRRVFTRNPRALVLHFAITPNHTRATARQIGTARAQLTASIPGIVAIRAPDFYGLGQFEELGRAIARELKKTARVSGVELWHNATVESWPEPYHLHWDTRWQLWWVANRRARFPLALTLTPSASCDGEIELLKRGQGAA
jgi:hypothetical protein